MNAAMETRLPRASDYTPEQRARNFIAPFLRDGYRLQVDGDSVRLVPGRDGQEIAPEWEKAMQRHSAALLRIRQRQMQREGVTG